MYHLQYHHFFYGNILSPVSSNDVWRVGVLHENESLGHECLKSSLAFRKPTTRPGLKASRCRPRWSPESLGAQRAAWRAVQHQLSAVGGRILLADRYACAYDPALCAARLGGT